MKTSLEIDEKKIELVKKLTHYSTTREIVDKALEALISRARRYTMAEMLGTEFFEGNLKKMRANRGRSRR